MARISLAYPKIPGSTHAPSAQCIAFEKCDGTNLHWIWERELGWYAFGMRRNRYDLDERGIIEFNTNHRGYSDVSEIFKRELATPLEEIFQTHPDYNSNEITVFTEYLGPNSFAGLHKADDPKELVLFDVMTENGIVEPNKFVTDFQIVRTPSVIYRGKLSGKFTHEVRQGKYDVSEGVVCKGCDGGNIWMVKIKTNEYMERLKQAFHENWEDYWE